MPLATESSLLPLIKAPNVIEPMFHRIARRYDVMNNLMTGGLHWLWKRTACRALNLQAGDRVLDLCTGTGDLAGILAKQVGPTGRVIGLDFCAEMLTIAKTRHLETNIQWEQADATRLPYPDNHFDGVIISFGLRNVSSVSAVLGEMVRVVRSGGWVVNLDTASDCKNPFFWFYFSTVMPFLGQCLTSDRDAYTYLCRSTQSFETPQQIADQLSVLGLTQVTIQPLGLGTVSLQKGQKP